MLFVGHQQPFPPSMLPSFLQGEALEVESIWVLLVQKTALGFCCLLRRAESEREPPPPAGSVTSRVRFCCPMASRT